MKQLTEEQIIKNWTKFQNLVESNFTGDRKSALLKIIDQFGDRMLMAPASYKEYYHNAHPGGYIEHILNVFEISMELYQVWKKYSDAIDYTPEEIALIALFHDLGKIGDITEEFYFPQDNDWRRNNMGEIYKINPNVINMNGADRSLYLLQHFGVQLTQNEWITIKIHEGMYDEGNAQYLKTPFESNILKSHLPHLIHHADMMAARIEYEQWKNKYSKETPKAKTTSKKYGVKKGLQSVISDKSENPLQNFFDKKDADDVKMDLDSLFIDKGK